MRDEIARGLVVRWLQADLRRKFQEMESLLPSEQSWKSSEILSHLRIQRTGYTPDPAEIAEMDRCWADFYKTILGPLTVDEDKLHPEKCCEGTEKEHPCGMSRCHHERDPRVSTEAKKMHMWDDFVMRHYKQPAIGGSIEASLKF